MANDNIPTRLSKAAREFNISIHTIVEFLGKKGHSVPENPNSKLTPEMFEILEKEFQAQRTVKEHAQKKGIDYSEHQTITIEDKIKETEPVEDEFEPADEIIIKATTITEAPQPPAADKSQARAEKKEEKAKEKPVEKSKEEAEVPVKKESDKEETGEVKAPEVEKKEIGPKVLGTIPVEKLEKKSGKKKPKAEKTEKAEEKKKPVEEKTEEKVSEEKTKEEKTPAKEEKEVPEKKEKAEPQEKEKKVPEVSSEEKEVIEEKLPAQEKEEDKKEKDQAQKEREEDENFIRTNVPKLTGPNVIGKIEIESRRKDPKKQEKKTDKKPVASSKDDDITQQKKKRKRIRKKSEQVPSDKEARSDKGKGRIRDRKGWKEQKQALSEEEISKQIKETLAKLTTSGKSKGSKYRREKRQTISQQRQKDIEKQEEEKKIIKVTEFVTVNDLANLMNVSVTQVISTCMSLGLFVSINQRLDAETLVLVAEEFGYKVEFVSVDVQEAILEQEEEDDENGELFERSPIATVMGHVDHGKTKLLDYIRKTNVIAGEAGGITQHIGAYEVTLENGKSITFLDTPGHEAFTAMRARGARITDVAIIVIAADDNVMPQTVEAINHAMAAGVPIVFAINKIDKPTANPEKIKEELSKMNILVEDWGGKYQSQEISAKEGLNVDLLLEKVLLEAEMLELKANPEKHATGAVIESSLDKGRGYVTKVLVQNGTLKTGDIVLAGSCFGKVKAMYNERNLVVKDAGPSAPVLLLGLNGAPQAGDAFNVMKSEREARAIATKRLQLQREQGIRTQKHITLDEIGRRIAIGDFKELNIIVKADVDGSVEALSDSLLKLSNEQVQVNVIHKSVGQVTESDVLLASASDAIIVGFQVRPSLSARKLAEQEQIDIRNYSIIYQAIEEVKAAIEGMLSPVIEEKIVCNIEVRDVFKISKVGSVAGCMVLDGVITRNTRVRVIRDGIVVYTGMLGSLKRFKDDVKEVKSGYECGLNIDNYNDIKVGDIIEGYEEVEVKKKL